MDAEPPRAPGPAPWYVRWLPALVIGIPALVSLAAWLGPISDHGLTGYYTRAEVSPWGVALVLAWFGSLIAVAQIGFARGRRQGALGSLRRVSVEEVHRWTCAVGIVGTLSAYWIASDGSASRIIDLWKTQQFNALREGFEYGVGIPTLRYATIIAGALTLAHLARRGRPRLIDAASLIGLIATSFLASRLALTCAAFIAITVLLASGRIRRPRLATVLIVVLAVVTLFTALNYSRNAGTYREKGVDNPLTMAAINAQAYVAAPTQVTLGFATLVMDGGFTPESGGLGSTGVLLPTYTSRAERSVSISSVVEVDPSLTTNGALSSLLFTHGWVPLFAAVVAVGLAAWGAGRFLVSAGIGPAIAGVLLYGMAELWRIFLFNQGILHFLALIGIVALVVGKLREPASATSPQSTRPLA